MNEEKYNKYYFGEDMIGPPDGQFMISSKQMNKLIDITNGDPAKLSKYLGTDWTRNDVLYRIDVGKPYLYNPRVPNIGMSRANSQYILGGFLPKGTPEFVTDIIPRTDTWSTLMR